MKALTPDPIDRFVGHRIQTYRLAAGMNQTELAKAAGVTFQQLQKYEKAQNRVSASRLFAIAAMLNCPVSAFFPKGIEDGLEPDLDMTSLVPLRPAWMRLDAARRRMVIDLATALAGDR